MSKLYSLFTESDISAHRDTHRRQDPHKTRARARARNSNFYRHVKPLRIIVVTIGRHEDRSSLQTNRFCVLKIFCRVCKIYNRKIPLNSIQTGRGQSLEQVFARALDTWLGGGGGEKKENAALTSNNTARYFAVASSCHLVVKRSGSDQFRGHRQQPRDNIYLDTVVDVTSRDIILPNTYISFPRSSLWFFFSLSTAPACARART